MGAATSLPTSVGLTSVSSATINGSAGVAVQVKLPVVIVDPTSRWIALTLLQPLTYPAASGLGPATPVALLMAKTSLPTPPGPNTKLPNDAAPGLLPG